MAVPARVLLEILLVVFFCREEVFYRLHLHCKLCPGDLLLAAVLSVDLSQLILLRIVNTCPVLNPDVISLPVDAGGVDGQEIQV